MNRMNLIKVIGLVLAASILIYIGFADGAALAKSPGLTKLMASEKSNQELTDVSKQDDSSESEDEEDTVKVKGLLDALAFDRIVMNGQTYLTTSETRFMGSMILGVLVEISAMQDVEGNLVALEVEVEDSRSADGSVMEVAGELEEPKFDPEYEIESEDLGEIGYQQFGFLEEIHTDYVVINGQQHQITAGTELSAGLQIGDRVEFVYSRVQLGYLVEVEKIGS